MMEVNSAIQFLIHFQSHGSQCLGDPVFTMDLVLAYVFNTVTLHLDNVFPTGTEGPESDP